LVFIIFTYKSYSILLFSTLLLYLILLTVTYGLPSDMVKRAI
jgi:hypothetical protein